MRLSVFMFECSALGKRAVLTMPNCAVLSVSVVHTSSKLATTMNISSQRCKGSLKTRMLLPRLCNQDGCVRSHLHATCVIVNTAQPAT